MSWSRFRYLVPGLAAGLLSCAPFSEGLRRDLGEREYDAVVADGDGWLAENGADPKQLVETRKGRRVVAEARLEQAKRKDTADAYSKVRAVLEGAAYRDLEQVAALAESHAWYRDRTMPENTLAAFRSWRSRFGGLAGSPDASAVAKGELAAAELEAMRGGSLQAEQQFRATYSTWSGTRTAISRSRTREVALAFAAADALDTRATWIDFYDTYRSWPEASEQLATAESRGLAAAIEEAAAAGDVAELSKLRDTVESPALRGRAGVALAGALLGPHIEAVRAGRPLDATALDAVFDEHPDEPYPASSDDATVDVVRQYAGAQPSPAAFRLLHWLLPVESPERVAVVEREKNLAWGALTPRSTAAEWAAFARRYPDDQRAQMADEAAGIAIRREAGANRWPRAQLTRARTLPGGHIELTVDVVDCDGHRLSGFAQDDFEVFVDGRPAAIAGFWGLEQDRPLDVMLDVDLSGSMTEEHEALRHALLHFAETFRFRGRSAQIGLVTFSDQVEVKHAPTPRVEESRAWLDELGSTHGGATEDGVAAMGVSADLMAAAKGERVVVFMSDEVLQTGSAGRRAVGLRADANCARLQSVAACLSRARTDAAGLQCLSPLGGGIGARLDRCRRLYGARMCLAAVGAYRLAGALAACGEPVDAEDSVGLALATRMDRGFNRPYFVVPAFETTAEGPSGTYEALAQLLQGRRLEVPQDATDTRVFSAALDDVADQLSRQSVIEVAPEAPFSGPIAPENLTVVVRSAHRWTPEAPLPEESPVALLALNADAACPDFLFVGVGSVFRTDACGTTWRPVATPGASPPFSQALRIGDAGSVVALLASGRPQLLDLEAGQTTLVETPLATVESLQSDASGVLWLGGHTSEGHAGLALRKADGTTEAIAPPDVGATLVPYMARRQDGTVEACVIGEAETACLGRDHGWHLRGQGSPPGLDLRGARVVAVGDPTQAILLSARDGAVYRSIGGGVAFSLIQGATGVPTSVIYRGPESALCLVASEGARCTDDLGRSWYRVGEPFERVGAGTGDIVGRTLLVARDEQLLRLDRVVTRELPSSSVYFATDADAFASAMTPFLEELVALLRRSPRAVLRIEGHADRRGDEAYNEQLARRRAEAVAKYLRSRGIADARLDVQSFGARRPIRQEDNEAAWSRNRRVELVVLEPTPTLKETDTCGRAVEPAPPDTPAEPPPIENDSE